MREVLVLKVREARCRWELMRHVQHQHPSTGTLSTFSTSTLGTSSTVSTTSEEQWIE